MPLERLQQFPPGAEDLVRIAIHDAADVGEYQRPAFALQQAFAEGAFQHFDLGTDRWLRESESLRRLRNAAFARDGPEVVEVMIVQPLHTGLAFFVITKTSV